MTWQEWEAVPSARKWITRNVTLRIGKRYKGFSKEGGYIISLDCFTLCFPVLDDIINHFSLLSLLLPVEKENLAYVASLCL